MRKIYKKILKRIQVAVIAATPQLKLLLFRGKKWSEMKKITLAVTKESPPSSKYKNDIPVS